MNYETRAKINKQFFMDIEKIAAMIPASVYWLDIDGVILGVNDFGLKISGGLDRRRDIIGKKHDNFYPKHLAKKMDENNLEVMTSGKTIEFEEEAIDLTKNTPKYYMSMRSPLRDQYGVIIGVMGISIDITDKKENQRLKEEKSKLELERLEFESQMNSKLLNERNKIQQIIDLVDASIYWKDLNGVYLGCNKYPLRSC